MPDVMIRTCDTGHYLMSVYLGNNLNISPVLFCADTKDGLFFENEEEAQATIDFIGNVYDFELAESLEVVIVP